MNQDFVTQLQLQLREAALREERRAPLAQRFVRARRGLPGPAPLAVAVVVALLAVAVAIGALKLRGEPEPVKPRVIHTITVSNGLESLASGFGSAWAGDVITGEVLRIDPETRKVVARIPFDAQVRVATGAGAVWALSGDLTTGGAAGPLWLSRIDPRTNRVVARIPVGKPSGNPISPLFVQADDKHVWVHGRTGVIRIDPTRNVPDRRVEVQGEQVDFVAEGERVWALPLGGRLRELDARTGRVVADVPLRGMVVPRLGPGRPGTLTLAELGRLTLIERTTGRALWRASVGESVRAWIPDGDALWVHVSREPVDRGQLVRLDADTGRRTGVVALPVAETSGLAKVGRDLWVATPGGAIMVVR